MSMFSKSCPVARLVNYIIAHRVGPVYCRTVKFSYCNTHQLMVLIINVSYIDHDSHFKIIASDDYMMTKYTRNIVSSIGHFITHMLQLCIIRIFPESIFQFYYIRFVLCVIILCFYTSAVRQTFLLLCYIFQCADNV